MAILNITYQGRSADAPSPLDDRTSDEDVRRSRSNCCAPVAWTAWSSPTWPQPRSGTSSSTGSPTRTASCASTSGPRFHLGRPGEAAVLRRGGARIPCRDAVPHAARRAGARRLRPGRGEEPPRAGVHPAGGRQEQGGGAAPAAADLLRRRVGGVSGPADRPEHRPGRGWRRPSRRLPGQRRRAPRRPGPRPGHRDGVGARRTRGRRHVRPRALGRPVHAPTPRTRRARPRARAGSTCPSSGWSRRCWPAIIRDFVRDGVRPDALITPAGVGTAPCRRRVPWIVEPGRQCDRYVCVRSA